MKDYVGQWFEAYRELGEPYDINFLVEQNGSQKLISVSHEITDGAGALFHIATENGFTVTPKISKSNPPKMNFGKYFLNIVKFLYWSRSRGNNLWNFKFPKAMESSIRYATLSLSASETQQLHEKARSKNISLNTLLLFCLDTIISKKFGVHHKTRSWWIPVSMRPDLGIAPNDPTAIRNYVSNFTLDLKNSLSPELLQKKISEALKQQRHWGTWWWQQLGRYLPHAVIRYIAYKKLFNNQHVGAFTNLGEWTSTPLPIQMTPIGNPLYSHPLCCSCIQFNKRLNLAIRVYPTFPLDQNTLNIMMQDWKQNLFDL
ncbi:MAG: hypothetical protein A2622_08705 [Bdellovibrionales bacterium RIFCSPHIGHO2_01_FULL_40_29]|nr:MAG: hypothetical protein A2622_08705 [Bdellovibrionales bacterium RIFCSPHIGHO2_01_FULL_40_29]OFZ32820.1 MAG: hypothetical protein A3D17_08915 [Bdellovibrionales bacterium RIFCSPHIGHO2_02_FULL_40_15]